MENIEDFRKLIDEASKKLYEREAITSDIGKSKENPYYFYMSKELYRFERKNHMIDRKGFMWSWYGGWLKCVKVKPLKIKKKYMFEVSNND